MNSRYEIEEASEFLEPVDKVPLIDDEDDYQVSIVIQMQRNSRTNVTMITSRFRP